jgi:hypothetical protein
VVFNASGIPTQLTLDVYDISNLSSPVSVAHYTTSDTTNYLQRSGTIAVFANAGTYWIDNLTYTTVDEISLPNPSFSGTIIPISDENLYRSPYNRYSGNDYKQTNAGGAYVKLAFSGTTL